MARKSKKERGSKKSASPVLDRIKGMKNDEGGSGGGSGFSDIYMSWQVGENKFRLVGMLFEGRVHFVEKLTNSDSSVKAQPCLNWIDEAEVPQEERKCPWCKAYVAARKKKDAAKKSNKEKLAEKYDKLCMSLFARRAIKWNIISREKPWVIKENEDGEEKKVRGLRVASFGNEAFKGLNSLFEKFGDLTDPDEGIELIMNVKVLKTKGGKKIRNEYKVEVDYDGTTIKQIPLTDKEKKLKQHDLSVVSGRIPSVKDILLAMNDELLKMIGMSRPDPDDDDEEDIDKSVDDNDDDEDEMDSDEDDDEEEDNDDDDEDDDEEEDEEEDNDDDDEEEDEDNDDDDEEEDEEEEEEKPRKKSKKSSKSKSKKTPVKNNKKKVNPKQRKKKRK